MPITKLQPRFKMPIKGSKDLNPPEIDVNITIELDFGPLDSAIKAFYLLHYSTKFEPWATKKLEEQAKFINEFITSAQKELDRYVQMYKKIDPAKDFNVLKKLSEQIKKDNYPPIAELIGNYNQLIDSTVKNIQIKMEKVWRIEFDKEVELKATRRFKKDFKLKRIRHIVGCTIRTALNAKTTIVAIATTVVLLATGNVVLGGIAGICASIGTLTNTFKVLTDIKENWDLQKRSIKNIETDLKALSEHMNKTKSFTKGLPKHLNAASKYHHLRQVKTKEINANLAKIDKDIWSYQTLIPKLGNFYAIRILTDNFSTLINNKKSLLISLAKMKEQDKELESIFQKTRDLVKDIDSLDYEGPKNMLEYLERYKNAKTVVNVLEAMTNVADTGSAFA